MQPLYFSREMRQECLDALQKQERETGDVGLALPDIKKLKELLGGDGDEGEQLSLMIKKHAALFDRFVTDLGFEREVIVMAIASLSSSSDGDGRAAGEVPWSHGIGLIIM